MSEINEITSYEVEPKEVHSDAGQGYEVTCPECGDKVTCADDQWWDSYCRCGYRWQVSVIAKGNK